MIRRVEAHPAPSRSRPLLLGAALLGLLAVLAFASAVAAQSFAAADLAGTWHVHGLVVQSVWDGSSVTAPGSWFAGSLTLAATGALTAGSVTTSDDSVHPLSGGRLAIASTGSVSGTILPAGEASLTLQGQMLPNREAVLAVAVRGTGAVIECFYLAMTRDTGEEFAAADLDGTWRMAGLQTPDQPSAGKGAMPIGSLVIDAGRVTGGVLYTHDGTDWRTSTFTGDTVGIDATGLVGATVISQPSDPAGTPDTTTFTGVMLPDKQSMVGVGTSDGASSGGVQRSGLFLLQREPSGSFAQSDLAGTWKLQALDLDSSQPNLGDALSGTFTGLNGTTAGTLLVQGRSMTLTVTGSLALDTDGVLSGALALTLPGIPVASVAGEVNASMGAGRDTIGGTLLLTVPAAPDAPPGLVLFSLVKQPTAVIRFAAAAGSVGEAAGSATIAVTRSAAAGTMTVAYAVTGGTATRDADYTLADGTLTFAPGETAKTIPVGLLNDTLPEGNETVVLTLHSPTGGATLGTPATFTLTLVDDEQAVQFSQATYTAVESNATVRIPVTRTGPPTGTVTVQYTVVPGTAVPGTDFLAPAGSLSGTLTFAPAQTTASLAVPLKDDAVVDGPKTLTLTLLSPAPADTLQLGPQRTATLTLLDPDQGGVVQFAVAGVTVAEGATASLPVTRTGTNLAGGVTVAYAVTGGTATTGFSLLGSGTLTFAAGETAKTVQVATTNDTVVTGARTVLVGLQTPTGGASLGARAHSTVTITENDQGGVLQFAATAGTVAENVAGGTAAVKVTRTGANLAGDVTVAYAVTGGTATRDADYTLADGTLTFAPGETAKTIPVGLLNDTLPEGNETVVLTLHSPTGGATLGTPATFTLTLTSDDVAQLAATGLAPTSVAPGKLLTITGNGFDPSRYLYARFSNDQGYSATSPAIVASSTSLTVLVPPYLNPSTGEFSEGIADVQVVQPTGTSTRVSGMLSGLTVTALPTPTVPAGSLTLSLLQIADQLRADADVRLALLAQTPSSLATTALRSRLAALGTATAGLQADIADIVADPTVTRIVGYLGEEPLALDAATLATLDRLTAAYLIGLGPNSPSPCSAKEGPGNAYIDALLHDPAAAGTARQEFGQAVISCTASEVLDIGKRSAGWFGILGLGAATAGISLPLQAMLTMAYAPLASATYVILTETAAISLGSGTRQDAENALGAITLFQEQILNPIRDAVLEVVSPVASRLLAIRDSLEFVSGELESFVPAAKQALARIFPPSYTLTLAIAGTGTGSVPVSPEGTSCGANCLSYSGGTVVTLTAVEQSGARFKGWSGACAGTVPTCTLTMSANKSVTATFEPILDWVLEGSVTIVGETGGWSGSASLPRSGGTTSFTDGIVTTRVTTTAATFSVSGSGFGVGEGATCSGSAAGSGTIGETTAAFSAAGPVSGTLRCIFDDGSSENYPITGSFTATAPK